MCDNGGHCVRSEDSRDSSTMRWQACGEISALVDYLDLVYCRMGYVT